MANRERQCGGEREDCVEVDWQKLSFAREAREGTLRLIHVAMYRLHGGSIEDGEAMLVQKMREATAEAERSLRKKSIGVY